MKVHHTKYDHCFQYNSTTFDSKMNFNNFLGRLFKKKKKEEEKIHFLTHQQLINTEKGKNVEVNFIVFISKESTQNMEASYYTSLCPYYF